MTTVKERANAKINLYLDVVSKREDGFHDILTVMHSLSFGDEITVTSISAEKTKVRLKVVGAKFLPTDTRNLAVKAAYLFLERAKLSCEVTITLVKRIPISAGLAGGSSDAAAVLRAMNKIHSRLFSIPALSDMAAELGSDVAYCLYGRAAVCEGRGEEISRLQTASSEAFVIAIANERISTPAAYKELDNMYADFSRKRESDTREKYDLLVEGLKAGRILPSGLYNIFEDAVLPKCEGASQIKKELVRLGANGALMSGSGPSVFGVFDTLEDAKKACHALREMKYRAYYATLVK